MRNRSFTAGALIAACLVALCRAADEPKEDGVKPELAIGDSAPGLQVQEFVKGEPVKQFEKGKIYVVEFWATWCGPCRESIPHLSKLQQENKNVTFVGVSVDEQTDEVSRSSKRWVTRWNIASPSTPGREATAAWLRRGLRRAVRKESRPRSSSMATARSRGSAIPAISRSRWCKSSPASGTWLPRRRNSGS